MHVCLIHFAVRQKLTQHSKATPIKFTPIKINKKKDTFGMSRAFLFHPPSSMPSPKSSLVKDFPGSFQTTFGAE